MADRTFLQSYVVSGASAYRSFRLIESAYDPGSAPSDIGLSLAAIPAHRANAATHGSYARLALTLPNPLAGQAVSIPPGCCKKQGDYPAFWYKDASFIGVMEELYERVRTKNGQIKA